MAELVPASLSDLVRRALAEHGARQSVFDLPASKWYVGNPAFDLEVQAHGGHASTPAGPAAGPHTQLAQNIVLGWLGGARIFELKTVQVLDDLKIPRPCIDATNVGYNVEWSQELRIEQTIDEYVKAAMLLPILAEAGVTRAARDPRPRTIFDLSIGYDLAGVKSEKVTRFLRTMLDARAVIVRLRDEHLKDDLTRFARLDFPTRIADSLTLSTFHGCPASEIESIVEYLLRDVGLHVVVKLNPTLLGFDEVSRILHDQLGYTEIRPVETEFARDLQWDQAIAMMDRLRKLAASTGKTLGAKFTNTLVVENHRDFFPKSEARMYLSGPPLHPISMSLALKFRHAMGADFPISFSAGIDAQNFPLAVACGMVPVTTCTDLLRPGGYARLPRYLTNLEAAMEAKHARTIRDYIAAFLGHTADPRPHDALSLENMQAVVEQTMADPRYSRAKNSAVPRKLGSALVLLDCVSCDKCVPVCPNDANFTYDVPPRKLPTYVIVIGPDGTAETSVDREHDVSKDHQLANYADFCNECGNCDVFCPEDGGPYLAKPRFFGSLESYKAHRRNAGFYVERAEGAELVWATLDGREYRAELLDDGPIHLTDSFVGIVLDPNTGAIESAAVLEARAIGHRLSTRIGLTIHAIVRAVLDPRHPNPVNASRLAATPAQEK